MPELPEVETIARDLDRALDGARVTGVTVTRPDVLREVTASELAERVTGAAIERVWRRAKHAVIDLSTSDRIALRAAVMRLCVTAPVSSHVFHGHSSSTVWAWKPIEPDVSKTKSTRGLTLPTPMPFTT